MRFLLTLVVLFTCISSAEARRLRHVESPTQPLFVDSWQTTTNIFGSSPIVQQASRIRQVIRATGRVVQMLAHPSGCPRRAFCGCGAAVEIFGTPRRDLWLARAWYKFPRSQAASGRVAVRAHHVFVLDTHVSGDVWLVRDYNSGGHASRLHERSIAGYTIVNPRA